jgi:hypothetical protein
MNYKIWIDYEFDFLWSYKNNVLELKTGFTVKFARKMNEI